MLRRLTVRKILLVAGIASVAAAIPLTVFAATGVFGGRLDRQRAAWTTNEHTTPSTNWSDVPGLSPRAIRAIEGFTPPPMELTGTSVTPAE